MMKSADELAAKLSYERDRLRTALDGVDADMAARRIEGVDGWTSIHDAMKHVASAEQSMMVVVQRTLDGTYQRVEDFDLNRFNARQVEKRAHHAWSDTLAELERVRVRTLATLAGLSEEQLAIPTFHPVWGEVDIAGMFRIVAIHDGLHRKDVESLKDELSKAS